MRTLRAVALTLSASALLLGGITPAGASTAAKDKPPVKISGDVNNKGTGKVSGDAVEHEAGDLYFEKTFIKGKPGSTVGVTIENEGSTDHTFTIDAQGVDEELAPGDSIDVDVKIPKNRKPAVFYCRFHESSGMQGAFFSKKGSSSNASAGAGGSTQTTNGGGGGYGY
jgi:plastocyanin